MKAKRICVPVLALVLITSMTACTKPNTAEFIPAPPAASPQTESGSPANSENMQPAGDVANATPEIIYTEYPFREMGVFSEDRAWVKYGGQNALSTALIDNTGAVLFQTDFEISYCSPFEDGLSYCLVKGEPDYTWFIIDSAGTITAANFDLTRLESDLVKTNNYMLFGYADGHFLVAEHITGFDANEWRMGTIDKNGNVLNELKPRPDFDIERTVGDLDYSLKNGTLKRLFYNAGDGIVSMQYAGGLYNVRDDKAVALVSQDGIPFKNAILYNLNFNGRFNDGFATVWVQYEFYIMSSAYISGDMNNTEIYKPIEAGDATEYSEGLYAGWVQPDIYKPQFCCYLDLNGDIAITFPEYEGRDYYCAPFSGGYAAMSVEGVDNFWYITVIDKTGKRMYEPIKTDAKVGDYYLHSLDGKTSHGYIYDIIGGEDVIITPDGKTLKPGADDLSVIGKDISFANISNGFIHTNKGYTSLDGKTVINSLIVEEVAPVTDEKVIPASTYTGSFNLAGMWKSGNGIILSFNTNGTVGPMLFGFEGGPEGSWTISSQADENGHYTLNASHLTGGNIIYKVRLLGKDEIEIYEESGDSFGASYYHLWRQ
jgi:hypothetical protein